MATLGKEGVDSSSLSEGSFAARRGRPSGRVRSTIAGVPAPEYSSFPELVRKFVIPPREANPKAERLDGQSIGSPPNRDTVAVCGHIGRRWEFHGDTRLNPVMVAYSEACEGRNPFITELSKRSTRYTLRLSLELRPRTADPAHHYFYAYEI